MCYKSKISFVLLSIFLSLSLAVGNSLSETVMQSSQPLPSQADVEGDFPAPPSTPAIYDPGTTIVNGDFTVDWSDSTSPAGLNVYEFEEAASPEVDDKGYFINRVGVVQCLPVSVFGSEYSFVDHPEGTYYFHVRAEDVNGFKSNWSNIVDLTLDFPSISNVQVSNVTQTSATVTWQTDKPSNSRVRPRGFYKIYDESVTTETRVQGVLYAPVEAHGPEITAAEINKDLEDLAANNVNAVNLFNLGGSELDKEDAVYADLEERIFAKCAELGLKFVVRLEAYQKPGFDYGTEDADWIIDTFYAATIQYAQNYSTGLLYYMINMPLDDPELIKPTETQQRDYVTYFYNKLKTIDLDGPVFVNFHYGCMDELDQASVADIVDGISIAQYAVRFDAAPYGVDYDANDNGEVDPGEGPVSTDPDYKIIDKDQFDYFIDKLYTLNDISTNGDKVYIDQSGFAELINHWSGTCADRTTKLKAMDLLAEYVVNNPQLDGWFYFKVYDKDDIHEQATFGILDTKVQGNVSESVTNHTVILTDLFPGTSYEAVAKSGGAEAAGPSFETLPADLQVNDTPTITITSPAACQDVGLNPGEELTITWRDKDTDNNAAISLYYDTDDRGRDGMLIVSGLSEDDETDSYTWDTSGIAQGESYYIYVKIDDGVNQAEYDYSNSKVSVYPIASASSNQGTGYEADKAFDGDPATRWGSAHGVDPQWIQMDFGSNREIYRVVLTWEDAYATAYQIQISDDAVNWIEVHTEYSGDGGTDDISFSPVTARYIRMYGIERINEDWGYSLYEFRIYSSLSCTANYLNPRYYNEEGIPVYYIGDTVEYELHFKNLDDQDLNSLTIQSIQEYNESGTGYNKGDPLPGDSTQIWINQTVLKRGELILVDSYYITAEVQPSLDQTHVVVSQDGIELYNNNEVGIWCPPAGKISGQVTIQGRNNYSELIAFELRNPGETVPIETFQMFTGSDGKYTLTQVTPGTYDVTAKSSNTLRAKQGNVVVTAGGVVTNIDFALLGGDANDDNKVNYKDRNILKKAYGTVEGDSKWDERADFNGDNKINYKDRNILKKNYGQIGEE